MLLDSCEFHEVSDWEPLQFLYFTRRNELTFQVRHTLLGLS